MTGAMQYSVGQRIVGGVVSLKEAQTTPPKRFKDGTLITAMTNIHRYVTSEADRKVLRDKKGIGTDRTRAAIIETLKNRKYMTVGKGGELHATDLGMELIRKLPKGMTDPVTTAKWEMALDLVAKGKMTKAQFDNMIRATVVKLIEDLKGVTFDIQKLGIEAVEAKPRPEADESIDGHGEACQKCKSGTMFGKRLASGKRVLGCSNFPKCKHSIWINEK